MAPPNHAFVGNVFLARGDGGSPTLYTRICTITDIGGIGQTNEQIESTTFCSGGVKEYIAGLADGSDVDLTLNFSTHADDAVQKSMIRAVKQKLTEAYRVEIDGDNDGVVDEYWYLNLTALKWSFAPNISAKNVISFGSKVSGDIVGYDAAGTVIF